MFKKIFYLAFVTSIFVMISEGDVFSAQTTVPHEFSPIEWSFQGKPIPETHWSPWLPLGTQELIRLSFGFRFSSGTIGAKCPVKLTFKYDPANAKSGRDLPIKVKAQLLSANNNTFESAFGISLPNKLQVGFFGITGVPNLLPWWDLPWDFWDILGSLPIPEAGGLNIPALLASAKNNIGVNTSSTDALPLGTTKSYHDQRTLISVDLKSLVKANKSDLAVDVYNRLSNTLGSSRMGSLLTTIQIAKGLNEAGAVEFLTDLCGDAVDKLAELASIALMGDPYFSVEGVKLRVNVRCFIPGGKGSGNWVLYFDRPGQEKTINFRDITPFVQEGDKLTLIVDKITYEFKLRQGLTAQAGLSLATVDLENVEKVVSYVQAGKDFTESDFKLEIPLTPSDDLIQSLRVHPGCVSASVNWASPTMPVKGTVKAYDGNRLVKTVTESRFKNVHNVIVTGLTKSKTYRFELQCLCSDGQMTPVQELSATTEDTCELRIERSNVAATNEYDEFYLTNPHAQAGTNYIDFSWTTNSLGSTEVLISPSPDLSANYLGCVKKEDGTVTQGWVTQGGQRKLETAHTIRVVDLEPGTIYYYSLRSWKYDEDTGWPKNPKFAVGKVGQITTQAVPEPPSVKVKAKFQGASVREIPIVISRIGDSSYRNVVITDQTGTTPLVTLEKAKRYTFSVLNQLYYNDITSPQLNVPNSAQGELNSVVLNLTSKPSPGGYVLDSQGNPLSGAAVKIIGKSQYQTTTDSTGHYTFEGFNFTSGVQVEISKTNFVTKRVPGRVKLYSLTRLFSVENCVLENAVATINFVVKTQSGSAIRNATLVIKEGSAQRGTLTTNSQGKATFTHNFNDNNANRHNLTVAVQPPASTNILPATTNVSIIGGAQRNLEINCLQDTQGPIISDVTFTQINVGHIQVSIRLNDETATSSLEYKMPAGQTKTTDGVPTVVGGVHYHYFNIQENTTNLGVYKIKVRAEDSFGNETETDFTDFTLFGGSLWNLKADSVTRNSAVLSWNKYPYSQGFGKYLLTTIAGGIGNKNSLTITNINTTSYTVRNLTPNTTYIARIFAKPASGSGYLATFESINFKTQSSPPVINNFGITPAKPALNQQIQVAAQVTDPDTNIKEVVLMLEDPDKKDVFKVGKTYSTQNVQLSHTFTPSKSGRYVLSLQAWDENSHTTTDKKFDVLAVEVPEIKFESIAKKCNLGRDCEAVIEVTNSEKVQGQFSCDIDWGDEKQPKAEIVYDSKTKSFKASHQYQKEGAFTVTAAVSCKVSGVTLTSSPVTSKLNVTSEPMQVVLTRDTSKKSGNSQKFHITATQGSYPVKTWTLDFGDGRKETGTGQVDKDQEHLYSRKGEYAAEFKVVDSKNNTVSKKVSLDETIPSLDAKNKQAKKGDLVVSDLVISKRPAVGKEMTVEANVKNDSDGLVNDIGVTLYVAGKKAQTESVSLKAQQTNKVTFKYTPVKAGKYTFKIKLTKPKGFTETTSKNNSISEKVKVE